MRSAFFVQLSKSVWLFKFELNITLIFIDGLPLLLDIFNVGPYFFIKFR